MQNAIHQTRGRTPNNVIICMSVSSNDYCSHQPINYLKSMLAKTCLKKLRVAHSFSPRSIMAKGEQQLKRWDEPTNQPTL